MTPLRIKLCGFTRPDDARVAVEQGADMIGLILWAPSPRAIGRDDARRVREVVPSHVALVGVFVDEEPETVDELVDAIGLDHVQLHGAETEAEILRHGERALRGVRDGDARAVPEGVPVVFDGPFSHTATRAELEAHWASARTLQARAARAARRQSRPSRTSPTPSGPRGPTASTPPGASSRPRESRITIG